MWIKTKVGSFQITAFNTHDIDDHNKELWVTKTNAKSFKIAEGSNKDIALLVDMLEFGIKSKLDFLDMTITKLEV